MKEKGFWEGAQAAMPTALGYVSIGLACGIIGAPYVTPVEMGLMSLFVYAGSAQFAMLALIAVQAPVAAIAMTVFLINLRLFLLSLHASTYFRHTSLWQNIGMSSLLTDETYGVLMGELAHTDKVNPMWMHGNNLNSYVAWFVGTVVGTALGGLLPNPEIFGLDFALVGMFIGIFASQFQIMQRRIPVRNLLIILAVVAVSFFLLFPECVIIVHAVAGAFSAHLLRQYEEKDERKRILGGGAGSYANGPWLCQYRAGLRHYRCALCDTCRDGLDESLCLCWECPVCHASTDCSSSTCGSYCYDGLFD